MEARTHDLSRRTWGQNYEIMDIANGGNQLRICVWNVAYIRVGDYLILQNGQDTTRYLVEDCKYMSDPEDQCFARVTFAPRTEVEKVGAGK